MWEKEETVLTAKQLSFSLDMCDISSHARGKMSSLAAAQPWHSLVVVYQLCVLLVGVSLSLAY